MANKVLITPPDSTPEQILFRDATDFSPTAANNLQEATPTAVQLDLTSVADAAARQSTKADLGAKFALEYRVTAAFELAATPTAGDVIQLYAAWSTSATAGTANPGNASGSDSAYSGYSSNLAASVEHLDFLGVFVVTAQATATVQVIDLKPGLITAKSRYVSIIVKNESGAAFHSDAVESHIVFTPVVPEIQ